MGTRLDIIKRIVAWSLLFGFIVLLVNIFVFHFYLKESLFVYFLIAGLFVFLNKKTTF